MIINIANSFFTGAKLQFETEWSNDKKQLTVKAL
jgi:hypothetical protein